MATKRRDVLLPLSLDVPMVLTPAMANEPLKHKASTKHGAISSYLRRNARIIVAGTLLILMVIFGTRYVQNNFVIYPSYQLVTSLTNHISTCHTHT